MSTDASDARPPFRQVADQLRAEILNGTYEPGDRLPSQAVLTERFGVSRMTVQQALRELRHERLIVSRQGSGVYVRQRHSVAIDMRPLLEEAMDQGNVKIDFAGFSAESLALALHEPLEKVRQGILAPTAIQIRLLLADTNAPLPYPARCDGTESTDVRKRLRQTTDRYAGGLRVTVEELGTIGVIRQSAVETRYLASSPMMKLILVNKVDLIQGFYPVTVNTVPIEGTPVDTFDILGRDVTLARFSKGSQSTQEGAIVDAAQQWFDSVWTTVAHHA